MPKISQPIPDWIRNLKYPTHNEPDEFTYQIFLRKSAFGTWEIPIRHVGQDGAMANIQLILTRESSLRDTFEYIKSSVDTINRRSGKPVLFSTMQRTPPLAQILSGTFHPRDQEDYIPDGTSIFGVDLRYTNEEIIEAISAHLKELRKKSIPLKTIEKTEYTETQNELVNDIYKRPNYYLQRWSKDKILQAFDLALCRRVSGDQITIPEIVRSLEIQDPDEWRKTTLRKVSELMTNGVTEAIIAGLSNSRNLNRKF